MRGLVPLPQSPAPYRLGGWAMRNPWAFLEAAIGVAFASWIGWALSALALAFAGTD